MPLRVVLQCGPALSRREQVVLPRRNRCGHPTAWTILRYDGPNHLGLWCNVLPEYQMALITSGCVPSRQGPRAVRGGAAPSLARPRPSRHFHPPSAAPPSQFGRRFNRGLSREGVSRFENRPGRWLGRHDQGHFHGKVQVRSESGRSALHKRSDSASPARKR